MISIIMPNFNKAEYLPSAIESVLQQTCPDWELIIVDDGSSDDSVAIIEQYTLQNPRISLIQRTGDPRGGSACRNLGLGKARGEFLIFFDSDDLLLPHALQQRLDVMQANRELDFAVFPVKKFYHEPGDCSIEWPLTGGNHLKRFLMYRIPWQTMQPIWRRKYVSTLGGFDADFSRLQDLEFHARALLKKDVNYAVYPEASTDCCYRIIEGRQSLDQAQLLALLVENCTRYLSSISSAIDKESAQGRASKRHLNGTVFSITRKILLSTKRGQISRQQADTLLTTLYAGKEAKSSIPAWLRRLYVALDRIGLDKLPGINYTFKRAYIYLGREL